MVYSPTTKLLFSGSVDGTILVWNEKGVALQVLSTHSPIFTLTLNDKKQLLISGGKNGITLFRTESAEKVMQLDREHRIQTQSKPNTKLSTLNFEIVSQLMNLKSHSDNVRAISCSDTGGIYSAGYDKRICSYDTDSPRESLTKHDKCHEGAICCIAFDSQTKTIVTGSYDGQVKIWNQAGRCLDVLATFKDTVTSICYVSPTNEFWIVGNNRKITVYDPRNISEITPHISDVCGFSHFKVQKLHHSLNSNVVAGITPTRQIVVWKYNASATYRILHGHTDWIEGMGKCTVADGESVFTAGQDGRLLRWDCVSSIGADLYACQDVPDPGEGETYRSGIMCMDYSIELDAVITGGVKAEIKIWYLGERQEAFELGEEDILETNVMFGHVEETKVTGVRCLCDLLLVSVGYDKTIRFWDLHTKLEITSIDNAHDTPLSGVEYCSSNADIATYAVDDHLMKVWCIYRQKLKYILNVSGDVLCVKWCQKLGCWITSAVDQTICFWNTDGELVQTFWHAKRNLLTCMYVDSLNNVLLLATADKVLEIRDLEDFTLLQRCQGHTDSISGIIYLKEKHQYATCSWDKTVRLWQLHPSIKQNNVRLTNDEDDEDAEEEGVFVSSYERKNPLIPPKSLKATSRWKRKVDDSSALLKNSADDAPVKSSTGLGKKLQDLEERLGPQQTEQRVFYGGRRRMSIFNAFGRKKR
jgi:WD40 repeat protein